MLLHTVDLVHILQPVAGLHLQLEEMVLSFQGLDPLAGHVQNGTPAKGFKLAAEPRAVICLLFQEHLEQAKESRVQTASVVLLDPVVSVPDLDIFSTIALLWALQRRLRRS